MSYTTGIGTPTAASLHAGQSIEFGVQVNPRPLNFQQQVTVLPGPGAPGDIGTVSFRTITDTQWAVPYQAPATVTAPFDVTVQAVAHDPWLNQDRTVSFPVHVDP
jgi:hypothetical protein